ncbi:hypothetical protein CYY_007096 [Polysphondylium violaceum]|uniref:AB hydrolase-1 domain-containing protein n=1 Tax=Polysphondylium violaceum TaxID=133409 RepID=A0A8J4PQY1_9MYCE|nr:hypothetical protein CYY_007096 [Polysphondylium violaceum]
MEPIINKEKLTIVLCHGSWTGALVWQSVIPLLVKEGYKVVAADYPTRKFSEDVEYAKNLISNQEGNVLLVGYSYGGAVATEAGNHEKVVGIVYICGFALDTNESLGSVLNKREDLAKDGRVLDSQGFLWVKHEDFHRNICPDISKEDALAMSVCQKPLHLDVVLNEMGPNPAWKTKPCYYQVSNNDRMIPKETQLEIVANIKPKKTIHLDANHATISSHPKEVSDFILDAAVAFNN